MTNLKHSIHTTHTQYQTDELRVFSANSLLLGSGLCPLIFL